MTKKFDKLNETFNVDGDIIPVESETIIEKVEKIYMHYHMRCWILSRDNKGIHLNINTKPKNIKGT